MSTASRVLSGSLKIKIFSFFLFIRGDLKQILKGHSAMRLMKQSLILYPLRVRGYSLQGHHKVNFNVVSFQDDYL